jgi:hypothetical protein
VLDVAVDDPDGGDVGSGASRRAALARGGLLAPALRTGRARSRASGSPQESRWLIKGLRRQGSPPSG